jgi:hypothetical protein
MSGRAGRRGKDDRGITVMMVDGEMGEEVARGLVQGKALPLVGGSEGGGGCCGAAAWCPVNSAVRAAAVGCCVCWGALSDCSGPGC